MSKFRYTGDYGPVDIPDMGWFGVMPGDEHDFDGEVNNEHIVPVDDKKQPAPAPAPAPAPESTEEVSQ